MNKDKIYYFVGIKGSGMSAMAMILHDRGYKVMGSDVSQHTFTQESLEQAGIRILPFNSSNINTNLIVIAGNSFNDDHPEIKKSLELGLTVYRYHQFLGKMLNNHISIGISGAHGKTSTTGLLSHILSNIAPTDYLIGDGTGKGVPNAKFFIFEADEYRRHFLATYPDYEIMTNIDFDHPDYYKNINDTQDAFQTFANQAQKGIFVWGDDSRLKQLKAPVPIYSYGINDNDDFQAININKNTNGSNFEVLYRNKNIGTFSIPLFGNHNILNTLSVIAVSYFENIDLSQLKNELLNFKGVKRRFSQSKINNINIIDDYAHHPSEINATLDATRQEYPNKKVIVVFQPHTYTRTLTYLNDFAKSLNKADQVYVTPIYASPREQSGKVSSKDLINKINFYNNKAHLIKANKMNILLNNPNTVIVFMGAGDIQKYERNYINLLKNNNCLK